MKVQSPESRVESQKWPAVVETTVECPVYDSFRVQQVAGMFDVPLRERMREQFRVEIGGQLDAPWKIGLIVGPSGSGKTTIARELFARSYQAPRPWPEDRAVVDCLGERPIKEVVHLFTAVGFSSPPSWVKPYQVLSNGERFRCDLARALAGCASSSTNDQAPITNDQAPMTKCRNPEIPKPSGGKPEVGTGVAGAATGVAGAGAKRSPGRPKAESPVPATESQNPEAAHPLSAFPPPLCELVVFDEFTSVVDRTVARAVSAAIARAIRRGWIGCRFVAVTCHYDVIEWLTPDWVMDMATGRVQRRCLQRPPIHLEVFRCARQAWTLFKRHHYLSGDLSSRARCYLAAWQRVPVAFCALVAQIGRRAWWRISRLVTLPDYQGLGIGTALAEAVAAMYRQEGLRVGVTAGHPALVAHCSRSPHWRAVAVRKAGSRRGPRWAPNYRGAAVRNVVSFQYVG